MRHRPAKRHRPNQPDSEHPANGTSGSKNTTTRGSTSSPAAPATPVRTPSSPLSDGEKAEQPDDREKAEKPDAGEAPDGGAISDGSSFSDGEKAEQQRDDVFDHVGENIVEWLGAFAIVVASKKELMQDHRYTVSIKEQLEELILDIKILESWVAVKGEFHEPDVKELTRRWKRLRNVATDAVPIDVTD